MDEGWSPPLSCGNDHPLEYPNVLVGWVPCDCEKAGTYRPAGHQLVRCLACRWEWREGGCDKLVDGYPRP